MRPAFRKLPALLCLLTAAYLSVHLAISESRSHNTYDRSVSAARLDTRASWSGAQVPERPTAPAEDYATAANGSSRPQTGVLGLLSVPSLGPTARDLPLRLGTEGAALDLGVALYPNGVLPGSVGSLPIVGHRTSHGKPFEHLDQLAPGDEVVLETSSEKLTYVVFDSMVVDDEETWVLADTPVPSVADRQSLALITCTPKGSTSHRLVVFAVLNRASTKP